jgi:hypothetical protein
MRLEYADGVKPRRRAQGIQHPDPRNALILHEIRHPDVRGRVQGVAWFAPMRQRRSRQSLAPTGEGSEDGRRPPQLNPAIPTRRARGEKPRALLVAPYGENRRRSRQSEAPWGRVEQPDLTCEDPPADPRDERARAKRTAAPSDRPEGCTSDGIQHPLPDTDLAFRSESPRRDGPGCRQDQSP